MRRIIGYSWLGLLGVAVSVAAACGGSSGDGGIGGGDDASAGDGAAGDGMSATDATNEVDGKASDASKDSAVGDGGIDAARLPNGASCTMDSDCESLGCDYTMHCAIGRSCTAHNGGDTCGPTGTESCCTTIPVPKPGAPYSLDKYNVTAGRMRAFITSTGGNVRGYVQAHRPAWFETAWDPWLPIEMDDGTKVLGDSHLFTPGTGQDGVYQQLGPIHYGAAEQGGNEGCLTKEVGNARTYRLPDAINLNDFNDVQQYTQDVLDQKPQQCTTFFMFAAFCIWDGGRIASLDELDYAWDPGDAGVRNYPWGATPAPAGEDNAYPFDPMGTFGKQAPPAPADPTYANYHYNFWMPANIQCIDNDAGACDYSLYIAPPGRFPNGNGIFGHADFVGNVYNVALPMGGTPGTDPSTRTVGLNRTGAFDDHAIPAMHPPQAGGFRNWAATNKYLAVGARCSR